MEMMSSWPEDPPAEELSRLAPDTPRPALRPFFDAGPERSGGEKRFASSRAAERSASSANPSALDSLPLSLRNCLRSGRELARAEEAAGEDLLPTAVEPLDRLLRGGLQRGSLVELVGWRSSGRLSAVLAVLAAVTGAGEAAALIDLGDGLDPRTAFSAGVDLERLLWLRPRHMKDALRSAEMLLASGFPFLALELGQPPVAGGRSRTGAWLRLARAAEARQAALLVSTPYRVSGAAAATILQARRRRVCWLGRGTAPRLLGSLTGDLVLDKARGRSPGERRELLLRSPEAPPVSPPAAEGPKKNGGKNAGENTGKNTEKNTSESLLNRSLRQAAAG